MPEGHTVHRVALQLRKDLVGRPLAVSSPQGRFAAGAALLDGRTLRRSDAVGKHLFLTFTGELVLHVHLGLYGAWELNGQVSPLRRGGAAVAALGAPRRVRMAELETEGRAGDEFPPPPRGQVRVRLATDATVADLRGPTACDVVTREEAAAILSRLGPDPVVGDALAARFGGAAAAAPPAADRAVARMTGRDLPIGRLLMDQSVVAGVGNVYRAELLFRARLDPWTPGRRVPPEVARGLWDDWSVLLPEGIRDGMMITREDLDARGRKAAARRRADRHWVYGRAGEPCRVCGTPVLVEDMTGRKLYRCPVCQVPPA